MPSSAVREPARRHRERLRRKVVLAMRVPFSRIFSIADPLGYKALSLQEPPIEAGK
jgi:hypothetical protein